MASDAPCSDTGSSHKELYTPLMEFVHYMLPFLQVLRGISSEYAHVYTCIVSQDWIYPSVSISFRFHSLFLLSQVPVYGSFRKAFSNIRSVLVDKCDVSHGLIDQLLQRGVLFESHAADVRVSFPSTNPLSFLLHLDRYVAASTSTAATTY